MLRSQKGDRVINFPEKKEDFIELADTLRKLVGGRPDVAARYHDFTDKNNERHKGWGPWKGKVVDSKYTPQENELVKTYTSYKTGEIEYRLLQPLSTKNIMQHLLSKHRLGVYVLQQDFNVSFLAADFDDHEGSLDENEVWKEVKQFYDACDMQEFKTHIERSKSGKGYHVWVFFDEPVPAADVRAVGKWLFEESQSFRESDDFSTFDRFFPSQAALKKTSKSFGNLIGLPLFGHNEVSQGRTAWVDPQTGKTIEDQWNYTLEIYKTARNPAKKVTEFMQEWELEADKNVHEKEYEARDGTETLGDEKQFNEMKTRCNFITWVTDETQWENWPAAKEPLWFAWLSNVSRFENTREWAHQQTNWQPKYGKGRTDFKFDHARTGSAPHKCIKIREEGFKGCPKGGCKLPNGNAVKAPAGLSAWAMQKTKKTKDRSVKMQAPQNDAPHPGESEQQQTPWDESKITLNPDTGQPWPYVQGWEISNDGLKAPGGDIIALRPIWIDAITTNNANETGILIKFFDISWRQKRVAIPFDVLHESGGALGKLLALQGMLIIPGKEKWVSRFLIFNCNVANRHLKSTARLGWFSTTTSAPVFVLPRSVLGTTDEEIVYQSDIPLSYADTLHGKGKLAQWQKHIAMPCRGNPILMFALLCGFAGPLMKLCEVEGGGFHLYGLTTGGKTTAGQVAISPWGCAADPAEDSELTAVRTWETTGNALEGLAELHNHMILVMDEIGKYNDRDLGRVIYKLASGKGKERATITGGLRTPKSWKVFIFSTGELSTIQKAAENGETLKGGQISRLPDIPADGESDGNRAIVIDPHGDDAKTFIEKLKSSCTQYYGTAGPTFVSYLIAWAEDNKTTERPGLTSLHGYLRTSLKQIETFLNDKQGLPEEGQRVIRRFALVGVAAKIAIEAGILDWELVECLEVIQQIRDRWLANQGQERSEVERGLAHLRDKLLQNINRFQKSDAKSGAVTKDLLGWRVSEYFLLNDASIQELCQGYDQKVILKSLKRDGYLWTEDTGNKSRLKKRAPRIEALGNTRPYLYWISIEFLGDTVIGQSEEDYQAGVVEEDEVMGA